MSDDRIIWRKDFPEIIGITTNSVSRWIKEGRLPKYDVNGSNKTKGWKVSTLRDAGYDFWYNA